MTIQTSPSGKKKKKIITQKQILANINKTIQKRMKKKSVTFLRVRARRLVWSFFGGIESKRWRAQRKAWFCKVRGMSQALIFTLLLLKCWCCSCCSMVFLFFIKLLRNLLLFSNSSSARSIVNVVLFAMLCGFLNINWYALRQWQTSFVLRKGKVTKIKQKKRKWMCLC